MFHGCNCHAVGVKKMKDEVKELSHLVLKAFAVSAGEEEVFAEDD